MPPLTDPTFTPSPAEAAEAEASTQQLATAPACSVPDSKGQSPGSWDIVGGAGFPQRRLWPWVGWDVPVEGRRGVTPGGDLEERPAFLKHAQVELWGVSSGDSSLPRGREAPPRRGFSSPALVAPEAMGCIRQAYRETLLLLP